ncbi:MAG: hypothetical protein KAQ67_09845, partial [Gammaproteobacteria bacterium]|nr:hypothetical protein [Gammaproteobacteria bacterium]
HAAANYMSYEELTSIYSNWLEDIVAVQESLENNEEVPYDFMEGYLSEIYALFPQLGEYQARVVGQALPASEATSEQLETAPSAPEQVDSKAAEEENLFEKLNKKLDAAGSKTEDAEYELLHGVFEEMISEKENVSASTQQDSTQANMAVDKKSSKKKAGKQGQQAKAQNDNATVARKSDKSVVKKSIRVDSEKIDTLINQVGELVVDRAYFFQLFDDMRGLQQHLKDDIGLDQKEMKSIRAFTYRMGEAIASLSRTSNELQEGVMKVRMLPISQLFNRYPRLVHDLTRNNDKNVNLKVEGEDTELDKMVVENLSDPLIHIIRNAIDHGLESAEERVSAGKSETG